jgi:hypothetical protein
MALAMQLDAESKARDLATARSERGWLVQDAASETQHSMFSPKNGGPGELGSWKIDAALSEGRKKFTPTNYLLLSVKGRARMLVSK